MKEAMKIMLFLLWVYLIGNTIFLASFSQDELGSLLQMRPWTAIGFLFDFFATLGTFALTARFFAERMGIVKEHQFT